MTILQMWSAAVPTEQAGQFRSRISTFPERYRPIFDQTTSFQAELLGIQRAALHSSARGRTDNQRWFTAPSFSPTTTAIRDAEAFSADGTLFVVVLRGSARAQEGPKKRQADSLHVYSCGPTLSPSRTPEFVGLVGAAFGIELTPTHYGSDRFDELKAEGRQQPERPSDQHIRSARLLSDKVVRGLAIAIKASGGLLVSDLPRQLPSEARSRAGEIQEALQDHDLVNTETVVVCKKTQSQTSRVASREILEELAQKGLRCACGRSVIDERIEQAVTVTENGRLLLDGSRWLSVLLLQELQSVGVPLGSILIDQQTGGDEMDCLAVISGELALFELKDKEFNLGNAYSFGAKIGILRPRHSIIVTTEHVGNDAKEHFGRAISSQRRRPEYYVEGPREEQSINYVEGISALSEGIRQLASRVYKADAARLLGEVMSFAAPNADGVIEAFDNPARDWQASEGRADDAPTAEMPGGRPKS